MPGAGYFRHRREAEVSKSGRDAGECRTLHSKQERELPREVQWNRGDEIGVAFIRDETETAPGGGSEPEGSLAERMQKLEAEVAGLKRLVKELKTDQRVRSGGGDAA